jgi:serine/threonine protein kinase
MVGQTISHYRIVEKIGEGGMGVVYKATDTRLGRAVALKLLTSARLARRELKQRFTQEAKAASALNHPNIITIYDIEAAGDEPFMAMEFVRGKTLHQCIDGKGLPLPDVIKYLTPVADALSRAHMAGIVHRDLKPANIMVGDNGVVKLLDFGVAKLTEPVVADASAATASSELAMTEPGTILVTVEYMSPEQARGEPVDQRTDVWAFGCVLFETLTGQPPFGRDPGPRLARILDAGLIGPPCRRLRLRRSVSCFGIASKGSRSGASAILIRPSWRSQTNDRGHRRQLAPVTLGGGWLSSAPPSSSAQDWVGLCPRRGPRPLWLRNPSCA